MEKEEATNGKRGRFLTWQIDIWLHKLFPHKTPFNTKD